MSERKVLNKYYPPDFDPSKIPRLRLSKDRQYTVRLMAPCNMRCKTCGEYIYKGKKFNARKETVQNEEYLGIKIFRFYIKCPRCLAEITFKTDPENTDYVVEHGASRNFQALKLAEEQAEKEAKELEEEEKNNPMKLLENRTQASKQEMELLESLEELKDLNQRHAKVDFEQLLNQNYLRLEEQRKKQENEDEALIRSVFGKSNGESVKRIVDEKSDSESEDAGEVKEMLNNSETATDILCTKDSSTMKTEAKRHKKNEMSIGVLSLKSLTGIVKINKKPQAGLILNSDESRKISGQQEDSLTVKQPEDNKVQKQESLSISHSAALNLLTAYSNSDLSSESD